MFRLNPDKLPAAYMNKIFRKRNGQGLMETVFAIGILLMAVTAVLALTASHLTGQKESESQIIANNLGREAIEVVRNIRDSNWLAGQRWGLNLDGGNLAIASFDSETFNWQIDFSDITPEKKKLYFNEGLYLHENQGLLSPFSRELVIDCLCQRDNKVEEIKPSCGGAEKKIGLLVQVRVFWQEKGRDREIKISDLLYAWK
jgi:hypothetical protein